MYNFETAKNIDFKELAEVYKKFSNIKLPELYGSFTFGRAIFEKGKGSYIYDKEGNEIFDFTGGLGVANMGHNHPRILAVREEFSKNQSLEIHKNYLNRFLAAASYNLAQVLPGDLNYSFFCNSGSEAIDGALKISYRYHMGKRSIVLRSDRSFHGKTIGAGSLSAGDNFVSGAARFFFQRIPGVHTYNFNDLESIKENLKQLNNDVYAIFVEPYSCSTLTESSEDFLKGLRTLCDKFDILLVFDEIYSGFSKCGPNFYMEKYGIIPDIVCLSKALGAAKSSISAYVVRDKIYKKAYGTLDGALLHSTTYNSFGEECVTAMEACRILKEEKLSEKSIALEKIMKESLGTIAKKHPGLLEVRGAGTHFGLVFNPAIVKLQPLLKAVPIAFVKDPHFLKKLVVTSLIEEFYCKSKSLCAFSANKYVILNFSPASISDPEIVIDKINSFSKIIDGGLIDTLLAFTLKFIKNKF